MELLPVNFANLGQTLSAILGSIESPSLDGAEALGERPVYLVQGRMDSGDLSRLVPNAAPGFNVMLELWLEQSSGLLRRVVITGQVPTALIGTDALIERDPEAAAAAIRAIVATQNAIKADIGLATKVGEKLFPASGAAMIADVVARDLPYYDAAVSEEFVLGMNEFMTDLGWLDGPVAYDRVVATRYKTLWAG